MTVVPQFWAFTSPKLCPRMGRIVACNNEKRILNPRLITSREYLGWVKMIMILGSQNYILELWDLLYPQLRHVCCGHPRLLRQPRCRHSPDHAQVGNHTHTHTIAESIAGLSALCNPEAMPKPYLTIVSQLPESIS